MSFSWLPVTTGWIRKLKIRPILVSNKNEEYYARLRQYKKSDHPVGFWLVRQLDRNRSFLWRRLKGLPDSVDFVSLLGKLEESVCCHAWRFTLCTGEKRDEGIGCFLVLDMSDRLLRPFGRNIREYEKASSAYERYLVYAKWRHEFWDGIIVRRIVWKLPKNMPTLSVTLSTNIIMTVLIWMRNPIATTVSNK